MKNSANKTPKKSWEKTKVQDLVRHKSGRYYARTFGNNKEIWKSLPFLTSMTLDRRTHTFYISEAGGSIVTIPAR